MNRIEWFFSFLALIFLTSISQAGSQKIVDCLVASIDREIITLIDLKILCELIFPQAKVPRKTEEFLERIIEIKLVAKEAKKEVGLSQEEIKRAFQALLFSEGEEKIRQRMAYYGLSLEDLEGYIKEKLFYEKMIAERSNQQVGVTLKEIENYYREKYLVESRTKNEKPPPLVEVITEVEALVRKEKIKQKIEDWIEGLRKQAVIRIYRDCLQFLEGDEICSK